MSETNDPFAAFKEGAPPAESSAGKPSTENKKKAHKKKSTARPANGGVDAVPPVSSSASVASGKKPRKARKARQPRELKLGLSTLLDLGGLNDAENSALVAIATSLNSLPKKSRGRVSAALGKIFA